MASTMSIFQEGQSTARPPLFTGTNYCDRATRMRIYMLSNSYAIWKMTETKYVEPTTDFDTWTNDEKSKAENNSKAMNILFCALDKNEFNRISVCKTAYDIWNTLKITHEGTSKVKQSKISMLKNQFQLFKMLDKETISDMYSRLQNITHPLIGLGVNISEADIISKS